MPGELVEEILRGLGLERETDEQRRQRVSQRQLRVSQLRPVSNRPSASAE